MKILIKLFDFNISGRYLPPRLTGYFMSAGCVCLIQRYDYFYDDHPKTRLGSHGPRNTNISNHRNILTHNSNINDSGNHRQTIVLLGEFFCGTGKIYVKTNTNNSF